MKNFFIRLGISSILIPLLAVAIFFSFHPFFSWIFIGIFSLLIAVSLWEFYTLTTAKGCKPLTWLGVAWSIALIFGTYCETQILPSFPFRYAILILTLASLFLYYLQKGKSPLVNSSVTMLGIVYLTLPLSSFVQINYFFPPNTIQDGRWWLFYLLLTTKVTDTAAYFCGKIYGKTLLAPRISPKKTIEGSIGGIIAALIAASLFYLGITLCFTTPPLQMSLTEALTLALIISIITQFGDLAESLYKRDSGVKDSNQIPGLGGILDMMDSLVFTAPLVAFYLAWQYG